MHYFLLIRLQRQRPNHRPHQWKVPTKEENARNGLPETDWRYAQYDMLYPPITESIRYHYDFNGNRTAMTCPSHKPQSVQKDG